MIAKYISGDGREFLLNQSYEVNISECNPHVSSWKYESVSKQYGVRILNFTKDALEFDVAMKFRGSLRTINDNLDDFLDTCEKDVVKNTPGRFYIGKMINVSGAKVFSGSYLEGFFIEHETVPAEKFYGYSCKLKFVAPWPFWIQEIERNFFKAEGQEVEAAFLDYPYDYDYDYLGSTPGIASWFVDHYDSSQFIMTIKGYAEDPRVLINDYPYQVFDTLEQNEFLQINSRNGANTVLKYLNNGTVENLFNYRNKQQSVFEPIPSGDLRISWNGTFDFNIKLFIQRSTPRWSYE